MFLPVCPLQIVNFNGCKITFSHSLSQRYPFCLISSTGNELFTPTLWKLKLFKWLYERERKITPAFTEPMYYFKWFAHSIELWLVKSYYQALVGSLCGQDCKATIFCRINCKAVCSCFRVLLLTEDGETDFPSDLKLFMTKLAADV